MTDHDSILVLDYGKSASQTGHLIARGIRRANVYSEIVSEEEMHARLARGGVKGIVLPGGPDSVYEKGAPKPSWILEQGVPVLGVCYGHQFVAYANGGEVKSGREEYGKATLRVLKEGRLLRGIPQESVVWMSHGDAVTRLPEGFEVYGSTENCPIAAFGSDERGLFGMQYHAELLQTEHGEQMLRNFAEIAGCSPTWTMKNYRGKAIERIRKQVGEKAAISALSGGVDSSVTTALAAEAIGNNLIAVFVDHGGLREGEAEDVKAAFEKHFRLEFRYIDAAERFRRRLVGVTDPEEKRHVVGDEFANVFLEYAKLCGAEYLFQGTIYPDRIETRGGIKGHHNLNPAIQEFFGSRGGLVEPLVDLYKDEVRDLGLELGLPYETVHKQPCPGPNLYVRIEGEITDDKLYVARATDFILRQEIDRLPFEKRPWQYFTFVPESFATGVKGDARAFGRLVCARAVVSRDAMSADFWRPDWELLERISNRITNEVRGVTRVTYDITQKPPGTIEFM